MRSHPKKKSVTKQTKQRRTNIQKKQYRFRRAIINTPGYLKYFDPSIEAENRLLGIGEMVAKYRNCALTTNAVDTPVSTRPTHFLPSDGIQTQEGDMQEVQNQITAMRSNKRSAFPDQDFRNHKKPKISVTSGVDLAE